MYQVKYIKYWTSADAPEVDTYTFKSKKSAEELVDAFKEYYGEAVASEDGQRYPIESCSIYLRRVEVEKIETFDDVAFELCANIRKYGCII